MIYRYDELKQAEEDFYKNLSDDVKHQMWLQNDISFESYVLSKINPGDIIELNYKNYSFEVIGKY